MEKMEECHRHVGRKKVWLFQVEIQQWVVDKPFMEFNASFSSLFSGNSDTKKGETKKVAIDDF